MSQNRSARQPHHEDGIPAPVVVEFLRNAAESGKAACAEAGKDAKKEEENSIPLFWRVFGGTVLSIVSLVVMTAYSGFTGSLAEARADLGGLGAEVRKEITRLGEAQAELIKKEDLETTMNAAWRNLRDLGDDQKELAVLRTRCEGLLKSFKDGEKERRALENEMQKVREEQAADAERRAMVEELGRLRERLAGIEGKAAVKGQ